MEGFELVEGEGKGVEMRELGEALGGGEGVAADGEGLEVGEGGEAGDVGELVGELDKVLVEAEVDDALRGGAAKKLFKKTVHYTTTDLKLKQGRRIDPRPCSKFMHWVNALTYKTMLSPIPGRWRVMPLRSKRSRASLWSMTMNPKVS